MKTLILAVAVSAFTIGAAQAENPGWNTDPSLGEAIYTHNYKPVIGKFNKRKVGYNLEHLSPKSRALAEQRFGKTVTSRKKKR
ncbi:MAG: hypothetical protein AAGE61_14515 [Pseudomonadota bacterium]